jgi:hypothetical protein
LVIGKQFEASCGFLIAAVDRAHRDAPRVQVAYGIGTHSNGNLIIDRAGDLRHLGDEINMS